MAHLRHAVVYWLIVELRDIRHNALVDVVPVHSLADSLQALSVQTVEMSSEKFSLKWNDFESNISSAFKELRTEKDLFDCTLSFGARKVQAHKLILSACSNFFKSVFRENIHQHPLIYLRGVSYSDLVSALDFMYHGEVSVAQNNLNSFLALAEDLEIKGLTQNNGGAANIHYLNIRRQGKC